MKITAAIVGIIGLAFLLVGSAFRIMHWPGAAFMQYTGGSLVLTGALLIFILLSSKRK